ncbi:MAG: hypothetical protein P8Q31_07220, partial [Luminiphilus sp.]|nr:hypothetical protein [Luminiphilus sp.]
MHPRISDITRMIGVFDFAGSGGSGSSSRIMVVGLKVITGVPDAMVVITRVAFSQSVSKASVPRNSG